MNPFENLKKELEKASANYAMKKIINKMAQKINEQDSVIGELSERLSDIEESPPVEETPNGP